MTPPKTTLRFTEEMKGHIGFNSLEPELGVEQGELDGTFFMFHLTIETPDIDQFLREPQHEAVATGWIRCDQLGGKLPVPVGSFNLLVDSGTGEREMRYRLFFEDGVGNPLTFAGVKLVRNHKGFDVWSDTSTLYSKVLQGHVTAQEESDDGHVASGVLRIWKRDLARQLTTFRSRGPSFRARARAFALFAGLFLGSLLDVYVFERADQERPDS